MSCYLNYTSCLSPSTGSASKLFFSAIKYLCTSQCLITEDWPTDSCISDKEKFDFIIVGAGAAGSVVANRLSEEMNWKVLLLEAGGRPPQESIIPAMDTELYHSASDWEYFATLSAKTNSAHINQSIYWPLGKMLGGSSSHNGMKYVKGVREDYQTWYDNGNKKWHPDVVKKYFKKLENLQNEKLLRWPRISNNYGKNGPVTINRFNTTYKCIINRILESLNEIGIKTVKDLNTAKLLGAGIATATAASGVRVSSATAYLNTIRNRKNLKILTHAFVRKILISKAKKAYGVSVKYRGKIMKFLATREVILCAGGTKSPQVLMLSGIGSNETLTSTNIKCKVDQPNVGKNLQDHCYIPVTIYGNGLAQPFNTIYSTIEYLTHRKGHLAQSSEEIILAFYSKDKKAKKPDYQMHFTIFWKNSTQITSFFGESNLNYKSSVVEMVAKQIRNQTLYLFEFHLLRPLSRGYITLKSNNPEDPPFIYPNYFDVEADLDNAVKGIMRVTNFITNTSYFRSMNANIGTFWKPCVKYGINSYNYWKCMCLSTVTTIYHPVGTCQMGPDAKTAVVDDNLKVYGVKNLRIIDASIMPTITSGNTYGPTVMIAERASDLVKEEHRKLMRD